MKTSHRRAIVVLGLVVATTVSGSSTAIADAQIDEVGWWQSVTGSQPPEGGVVVGGNATGPTAVAAIRVSVSGGTPLTAELTLLEAGNIVGDTAGLLVCPTADDWTAVAGGSMDEAPAPDCDSGSTALVRDESGAWTAEVASLLTGETASLMIVPEPTGEDADPLVGAAPFEVSFEPPTLAVTMPTTEASEAPPSDQSVGTSTSGDPRPPFAPIPIDQGQTAFATPAPPGVAAPTPAAPAPGTDQVAITPSAPVPTRAVSDPGGGGGRNWGQVVSYLLMAAAAGSAAGVGRWQLRSRGLLPG